MVRIQRLVLAAAVLAGAFFSPVSAALKDLTP